MLTGITITGADDQVDPGALIELSHAYPFVEWGILFSASRVGTARYPSPAWVLRLIHDAPESMRLSAHVCGEYSRELLRGTPRCLLPILGSAFRRVQVNGITAAPGRPFLDMAHDAPFEFILQVPKAEMIETYAAFVREIGHASLLFDPSGGRGTPTAQWPVPPTGVRIGYAGGIRPSNVEDVIRQTERVARERDFWLDMESGVRVEDRFDVLLARDVLRLAALHIAVTKTS